MQTPATAVLQGRALACTRGERTLFDGLDLDLQGGEALRIGGDNGAGKTSLLRILCGLSTPNAGTVSWGGVAIGTMREDFCRQLTYIGHLSGIKDDLSACENLLLSLRLTGKTIERKAAYSALAQMGLDEQADLPTRVLSQGQKKRAALTRLLFSGPTPLWILDEPFAALDQAAQQQLTEIMNRHLDDNGMLIYSTHQEITLSAKNTITLMLREPC